MEDAVQMTTKHQRQTKDERPAPAGIFEHADTGRLNARTRRRPRPRDNDGGSGRGGQSNADVSSRQVRRTSSSIASLVTNPSTASEIPMHQIPALVAELASEQATLSAVQGVLTARLLASQDDATSTESTDHLLTAEQVATVLGVTKRWVERRARRLPFARRLSAHAMRYSESGLKRWMSNRQMRIA
jgi:predicted DNA-binding transcriptional regulator AlpA